MRVPFAFATVRILSSSSYHCPTAPDNTSADTWNETHFQARPRSLTVGTGSQHAQGSLYPDIVNSTAQSAQVATAEKSWLATLLDSRR